MKRLTPYLIYVLITAGLIAFIYKDRLFSTSEPAGGASVSAQGGGRGGHRRGDQIVPVVATKVATANVPVYLNGVGTVQAFNTATVRTQVSGRLIEVPYTEGQDVKEGDVLAKIDPSLYQAAYDQAVAMKAKDEALLVNARLDQKRYADLVKTNAASQQQADTANSAVHQYEAQVKLDQAAIDNAQANLQWTTIRAPFAGKTGIRLVDKGNLVSSSDATGIVIVTQLRPIAVVFTLPENTVSNVLDASGRGPVQLQAVTGGKPIGEGTLMVVDNVIDQSTGTYKVKGSFPNEQNRLWPGQFVNMKLKLKVLENAIVVPSVAVQEGANGSYVYLVTPENTAKIASVSVVQEGERQAVIASGVTPGDLVITAGFASVQDGSKVKVEMAAEAAATAAENGSGGAPAHARQRDGAQDSGGSGEHRRRKGQDQRPEQAEATPAGQGSPKP
jgi:membrane fusion protein, multidrug efflux system